jgi:hypothetical protein
VIDIDITFVQWLRAHDHDADERIAAIGCSASYWPIDLTFREVEQRVEDTEALKEAWGRFTVAMIEASGA